MSLEGELDVTVSPEEQAVAFAFHVTNANGGPIELQFADACRAEFVVERAGRDVWRFTDGRVFAQVMGSERLAPDETATYDAEWTEPAEGTFTAVASLRATDATCEASAEFTV